MPWVRHSHPFYDFSERNGPWPVWPNRLRYGGYDLPEVPFQVHIWEEVGGTVFDCFTPAGRVRLQGGRHPNPYRTGHPAMPVMSDRTTTANIAYVAWAKTFLPQRVMVTQIQNTIFVRVSKDGQGWCDEDVMLHEEVGAFPSDTLATQMRLLLA